MLHISKITNHNKEFNSLKVLKEESAQFLHKYQPCMEFKSLMVLKEGKCQIFGVKQLHSLERWQVLIISKSIDHT